MPDFTTVEVKGLKELAEALQQMPKKLAGKALGAAVKAGADLIRNTAQANARARFVAPTGAVEKSIVSYRAKFSFPESITYQVGVTMQKRWPHSRKRAASGAMGRFGGAWPAFWWRYTEFGTAKMAAKPWLRPAWDARSGEALVMIKKMLEAAVEKAADQVPKYRG